MNSNNLLDVIGEAKDSHVLDAVKTRNGVQPEKNHLSLSRIFLIAAVIALALLLMGCAVAYVLSLQELKIAEEPGVQFFDAKGEWVGPTEVTQEVISIRGYPGSPNQLATQEWYEFEQTYDPNHTLMPDDNANGIPNAYYYPYNCYTWEMVNKLDEILDKYHLKLLSKEIVVQRWQIPVMFDALGIGGVCNEENAAKINDGSGYFYPEGNFKYDFSFHFPGNDSELSPEIPTTLFYTKKDYFDPDYQSIDTEHFEQWTYTTSEGVEILIAMSHGGGYLFAETDDAFMTVSLHMAAVFQEQDTGGWKRQCMEQAAEVIDFSMNPHTPDMIGLEEKLAQAEQEYEAAKAALLEKSKEGRASYADYVKDKYIDNRENLIGTSYIRNYFALLDVTGDGQDELLLGRDDSCFNDIMTIQDGKVIAIVNWSNLNLCEDGVILQTSYFPLDLVSDDLDHPRYHGFGRIKEDAETGGQYLETFLSIDCDIATREWTMTNAETGETTPIAVDEIDDFLAKYPLVKIEMKPIKNFEME